MKENHASGEGACEQLPARRVGCGAWFGSVFPWRIVRVNGCGVIEIPEGHPARAELEKLRTENKRLLENLRERLKYLRAANKGAECNARVCQLLAARLVIRSHRDSLLPNDGDETRAAKNP